MAIVGEQSGVTDKSISDKLQRKNYLSAFVCNQKRADESYFLPSCSLGLKSVKPAIMSLLKTNFHILKL